MMDKNVRIEIWDEETQSKLRGWTTRETRDFHENRFVVLRNFIPKDIINMTTPKPQNPANEKRINV
jgi:hypothetical protein